MDYEKHKFEPIADSQFQIIATDATKVTVCNGNKVKKHVSTAWSKLTATQRMTHW